MSRTAESTGDFDVISCVLDASRAGEPVFAHDSDDHEGETDLIHPAGTVSSADVTRIRSDAGGLVCVTPPNDISEFLSLPFMDDVLDHPAASPRDLVYDSRSSFSFTVNHRDSFTDITDHDRAMTISRLAPVAETTRASEYDADDFGGEFRASDHVRLPRGAPNLLSNRQGHTKLGLVLANEAGISPAVTVHEMFDDETDTTLPKDATRNHANRHGFAFVDGDNLIDEFV